MFRETQGRFAAPKASPIQITQEAAMPRGTLRSSLLLVGTLGAARAGQPLELPRPRPARPHTALHHALREVVQAFAQAWFAGDREAIQACLHPDLVGRILEAGAASSEPLRLLRASQYEGPAAVGPSTPEERRRVQVRVLEAQENVASVRAALGDWIAFMHLARHGGRWTIANVLWAWQGPGAARA